MGRRVAADCFSLKRRRLDEGEGLYERARALEAAKYAAGRVVAREGAMGARRSPRLAESQGMSD